MYQQITSITYVNTENGAYKPDLTMNCFYKIAVEIYFVSYYFYIGYPSNTILDLCRISEGLTDSC